MLWLIYWIINTEHLNLISFEIKLRFKLIPFSVEIADIIWFRRKYSKKVPKWSECEWVHSSSGKWTCIKHWYGSWCHWVCKAKEKEGDPLVINNQFILFSCGPSNIAIYSEMSGWSIVYPNHINICYEWHFWLTQWHCVQVENKFHVG